MKLQILCWTHAAHYTSEQQKPFLVNCAVVGRYGLLVARGQWKSNCALVGRAVASKPRDSRKRAHLYLGELSTYPGRYSEARKKPAYKNPQAIGGKYQEIWVGTKAQLRTLLRGRPCQIMAIYATYKQGKNAVGKPLRKATDALESRKKPLT